MSEKPQAVIGQTLGKGGGGAACSKVGSAWFELKSELFMEKNIVLLDHKGHLNVSISPEIYMYEFSLCLLT